MRYRPFMILVLLLAAGCGAASVHAGMPTSEELAAVLLRYNEASDDDLPLPSPAQFEELLDGEMVDLRERTPISDWQGKPQDRIRVVGYKLVARPRLLVWLATLNVDTQHSRRMTEHLLEDDTSGASVWYQHLNTPWPVRNRHWVISNTKNKAIASETQGLVWEHRWSLTDQGQDIALNLLLGGEVDGLDEKDADSSIYLTVNQGAWTMFAVNDEVTLVAAHTVADMGGWIPERWVASFVSRQLGGVLKKLPARADIVHEQYSGEHVVFDGTGAPINLQQAHDIRRQFHLSQERSASAEPKRQHRK